MEIILLGRSVSKLQVNIIMITYEFSDPGQRWTPVCIKLLVKHPRHYFMETPFLSSLEIEPVNLIIDILTSLWK